MIREKDYEVDSRVKKKMLSWQRFAIIYIVMLLLVGVQMGIIVSPIFNNLNSYIQVTIIMTYWAIIALIFILITRSQITHVYDIPMRKLSSAAKKVAGGDFSVFVEPVHTPDEYDFIDVMFIDFNAMVQELGSIETLKNDFVSNVSHEIRTPLAIIKNYTSLLRKGDSPVDTQVQYMDTIVKATDNLTSLVSNILRLNKLDSQEIVSAVESYDLCRQLSDCVLGFESLLEEKNIDFEADIEDCAIIKADREMLEIVWNNLLSNAIKYTEVGGKISLSQISGDNSITVSVSDTGCGMNSETIKRIFDKFYQADTSHSGEGNGLGLALAYRIVEKLEGSLTVTSEVGKGSKFTVTIPVKR
ncbi:Signal transduction histidine kinase [Anaerosphaera aminiphila DSM 21120]|uniref:histidine kinase n=1 Tax=Anaerosphaera aminiphila DSM 21120 TaxID=1120995 RepID=A0A1M5PKD6_9FIRM|nr:HAMP domain-containing sensor histidine kinase [Anaerosphaera aminiphila]SHH02177.1 Signal transduction histidine kinase [Anaerosphaera aminiphila DSM 21120]